MPSFEQFRDEADRICQHMTEIEKDAWAQHNVENHPGFHTSHKTTQSLSHSSTMPTVAKGASTNKGLLSLELIRTIIQVLMFLILVRGMLHGQDQTRQVYSVAPVTVGHCVKFLSFASIGDSGAACGGAGGSPGGSNTQIQYNDAGSFNGSVVGTYVKASTQFNFQVGTHFQFLDPSDTSKIVQFVASGITTATTRTFTFPDANGTFILNSTACSGDLGGTVPGCTVTNGSHITNSSIPNSGLVNTGTTISGATCTLGSTCTVTRICADGLGDGLSAITAGTYLVTNCFNDFGATYTITNIRCFTDNNGTSTLNAANDSATGLLTGAVTCTNSFAAGTQSATTTIATSHWINFTFVADGASKRATFEVTVTR